MNILIRHPEQGTGRKEKSQSDGGTPSALEVLQGIQTKTDANPSVEEEICDGFSSRGRVGGRRVRESKVGRGSKKARKEWSDMIRSSFVLWAAYMRSKFDRIMLLLLPFTRNINKAGGWATHVTWDAPRNAASPVGNVKRWKNYKRIGKET